MQVTDNSKRKYYTKSKKLLILNELKTGAMTHSELARKHQVHPVTLYQWKRTLSSEKPEKEIEIAQILEELEALKKENQHLKETVGELSLDKKILETANQIYKKKYREKMLKSQKKSSKISKKKRR